jgi:hypothetical protein
MSIAYCWGDSCDEIVPGFGANPLPRGKEDRRRIMPQPVGCDFRHPDLPPCGLQPQVEARWKMALPNTLQAKVPSRCGKRPLPIEAWTSEFLKWLEVLILKYNGSGPADLASLKRPSNEQQFLNFCARATVSSMTSLISKGKPIRGRSLQEGSNSRDDIARALAIANDAMRHLPCLFQVGL